MHRSVQVNVFIAIVIDKFAPLISSPFFFTNILSFLPRVGSIVHHIIRGKTALFT